VGVLDSATHVIQSGTDLRDRHVMTFIFSTHDPRVVAHAVRVVTFADARVTRDEVKPGEPPHEILPGVGTPSLSLPGYHLHALT
jgi:hypothetical protein